MKVIAIYNIKGGDGKTTRQLNISLLELAAKNFKILLVDADGQANCSKSFVDKKTVRDPLNYAAASSKEKELMFITKYMHQDHGHTISDVFENPKVIKDCIQHTSYDNLDIVTSDLTLYLADTKLRLSDGTRENKLKSNEFRKK